MNKLMVMMAMAITFVTPFVSGAAEGIVYDVKCTLNTTTAKSAKPKTTTYTVNFGMNAKKDGVFWYMDDAIVQNAANPDHGDVGAYENVIAYVDGFKASRGYFTTEFDALAPEDKLEVVKMLSYDVSSKKTAYNYKSANKWCATVKFTIVPEEVCYKVNATEKTVGYIVEVNGCCSDGGTETPELYLSADDTFENLQPLNVFQYNRFGGATADKANKAELLCGVDGVFMLGGFGSYDVKNGCMTTFNGYVLGLAPAPKCTSCCSSAVNSIVHSVCGECMDCDTKVIKGNVTLKYNKKMTEKYNEM